MRHGSIIPPGHRGHGENTDADHATVDERIKKGHDRLARTTFSPPTALGTSS
jgi:hypothetical protein